MKRGGEGEKGLIFSEPLIFDRGHAGEQGYSLPEWSGGEEEGAAIPSHLLRGEVEGLGHARAFGFVSNPPVRRNTGWTGVPAIRSASVPSDTASARIARVSS